MRVVRIVFWVLLLVVVLPLFAFANWEPTVTVRIWEGLLVDTKIPAIVVFCIAIGLVPMWLYHRAVRWKLRRRIASLEVAARTAAETPTAARTGYEPDRTESEALSTTETPPTPAPATPVEAAPDNENKPDA